MLQIIFLIFLTGCASLADKIEKQYSTINLSDGVGPEETAIIAQKEMTTRKLEKNYDILQPKILDRKDIQALMKEALARASKAIDSKAQSRIIIKSVSAKQRPRRPGQKG